MQIRPVDGLVDEGRLWSGSCGILETFRGLETWYDLYLYEHR